MAEELKYWKSLHGLYSKDASGDVKSDEFPAGVTDKFNSGSLSGMSRKQFLALLAASAAFTAAGCRSYRDKGEIVPYTKKPEEVTPGVPNYYASTCTGCSQSCGILIKTREGRPIKVDGNPDHPINRGKICAKGQAGILNLYDPGRLRRPQYGGASQNQGALSWDKADPEIIKQLNNAVRSGKEIALIMRGIHSPTTKKALEEFTKTFRTAKIYSYELFNEENRRRAWKKCYGTGELPAIDWKTARIILAIEADILGTEGTVLEQIREYANNRNISKTEEFSRLYCLEAAMSLTGANADERLRLRPEAYLEFVLVLKNELENARPDASVNDRGDIAEFASKYSLPADVLKRLVQDLKTHKGSALIYAGDLLPEDVHTAVNAVNELLGARALYKKQTAPQIAALTPAAEIESLTARMKSGEIGVVIHFDSNPLYHFPKTLEYEKALHAVPFSIGLTETENETSLHCTMVLPINHDFESWGDFKIRTGILSLQQPVIEPLYDSRQKESALLAWTGGTYSENIYHEYLKNRWKTEVYPAVKAETDFQTFWYSSLHDGVIEFAEQTALLPALRQQAVQAAPVLPEIDAYAVVLTESYYIGDGRFAGNGWLQELPHPISKIVWDNYAAVSVRTAHELGVQNNDLMRVHLQTAFATLPVFVQPGQADGTVSIALGYGRTNAGPVGSNVGFDVNIYPPALLSGTRVFSGAKISKAAGSYSLASTQEHHALDDEFLRDIQFKRNIIREGTVEEYRRNPSFLHEEKKELTNIAKEFEYRGVKWAMSIDLNKCVGCNACVAGCNVENNIPVVGKEQAAKGREMQWIRIDRYYSGTDEAPRISYQPMLCQHCDNAPCENVCPVVATNHSPDGLNQMVYNRCVGTKYCSNNCPYKVRRFNFFNWRDNFANGYYEQESAALAANPEVTVRSRGVMEKCTFCVQRIMEARQHAAEQGRELHGNDVKTACQEACPATAIVFGDMHDPDSEISKLRAHTLGYHVLEETNVRPNVTYIAKLRNILA
ncbi:MAG: 4Fe-4S dicluster domain-containing protein [Bacteroidota bacterium]